MWGATGRLCPPHIFCTISIHAPRVGSDYTARTAAKNPSYFNPRSPCGERLTLFAVPSAKTDFNPRSPCGERHPRIFVHDANGGDFNPRSPCGERLLVPMDMETRIIISIHAPRVGSDRAEKHPAESGNYFNPRSPCGERPAPTGAEDGPSGFQSTLPVWGATAGNRQRLIQGRISIHAPRVGSDCKRWNGIPDELYFNPRSPCGERLVRDAVLKEYGKFQSTLPVWGATKSRAMITQSSPDFNPRSPCGERRFRLSLWHSGLLFQSTLPVWGATRELGADVCIHAIFQSTLPVWGATYSESFIVLYLLYFNPRSPCGERPSPSVNAHSP